ncbi:MAG TPA: hypothetical protein VFZ76_18640 [Anaerolineales bacterium]
MQWLEQSLASRREGLDPQTEAFIVWAWQHQKELDLTAEQVLPRSEATCVAAFWEVLSLFHRSSNLAESSHSWLRPYLQVHRGIPVWLLPLLQIFWNHHPFQRGERQGKSPLALAGVDDVPTLAELFDRLVGRQPSIRAPDFFCQKCATRFQPKFETFRLKHLLASPISCRRSFSPAVTCLHYYMQVRISWRGC